MPVSHDQWADGPMGHEVSELFSNCLVTQKNIPYKTLINPV